MSGLTGGVPGSPRVLHIHGSLAAGNPLAERCVRVMDGFGGRMRHTLVSGDGEWSALESVAKGIPVERRTSFPKLSGLPTPGRLQKIAQAMVDYHLVLTYGRGGVEAALAHTMFSQVHSLPPLIHHEDGSDETPRQRGGLRSTWYRRVGLGKAAGLVVPSELLEGEALLRWQQPIGRVKTIRDGVDLERLRQPRKSDAIPRLLKRPGEMWIGCTARMDGSEPFEPLLATLAEMDAHWHLVVLGEGSGRSALEAQVTALALNPRVHIVPRLVDGSVLSVLADVIAVLGGADPLPYAALLAMGAGKPVVGFESGALADALAPDNAALIAQPGDATSLAASLHQLANDDFLRRRTGEANRERAEAERDAKVMIAAYRRLYASAMGRETI